MLSAAYCAEKAEECELLADEVSDARLKREWLWMAHEWRMAAASNDDAPVAPADPPSGQHPIG